MRFAAFLIASAFCQGLFADDWPQWRGPNYDGRSKEELPQQLPDELPVNWKINIGKGFSTVSVQGDHVVTMGNDNDVDTIWCISAESGDVIWKHSYDSLLDPLYFAGGPCSTPTIHDGKVFTLSRRGHVFCLDLKTGEVIWERNLLKEHGLFRPEWSFSSSVVIRGDLAIYNVASDGAALDWKTGKTVWISGESAGGYASAVPWDLSRDDSDMLLFTFAEMVNLAHKDGEVRWRIEWETGRGVNAADPIIDGSQFLVSSTIGTALFESSDPSASPKEIWREKRIRCYFNPGVLIDGYVYTLNGTTHNPTELVCIDWKTGETKWSEPGFKTGGLMAAGNNLVLFDKGQLTIFPASPDGFEPILQQQLLGGVCWTMPVLANGKIYCRNNDRGELVCVSVVE
ncbi:MAG: PQQ-binding-like beta-propeller repeat protein [Verrucomicrobiota bacterium]